MITDKTHHVPREQGGPLRHSSKVVTAAPIGIARYWWQQTHSRDHDFGDAQFISQSATAY